MNYEFIYHKCTELTLILSTLVPLTYRVFACAIILQRSIRKVINSKEFMEIHLWGLCTLHYNLDSLEETAVQEKND